MRRVINPRIPTQWYIRRTVPEPMACSAVGSCSRGCKADPGGSKSDVVVEPGPGSRAPGAFLRIARGAVGLHACLRRHRGDERPHQHPVPDRLVLHARGLRPGAAEPQRSDPDRPCRCWRSRCSPFRACSMSSASRILVRIAATLDERLSARVYDIVVQLPLRTAHAGRRPGAAARPRSDPARSSAATGPLALFDLPWMPFYLLHLLPVPSLDRDRGAGRRGDPHDLTLMTEFMTREPSRTADARMSARATASPKPAGATPR